LFIGFWGSFEILKRKGTKEKSMKISIIAENDQEKEILKKESLSWTGVRNFILAGQSFEADIKLAHGSDSQNIMESKAILSIVETAHENRLSVAREADKIGLHMKAQQDMAAMAVASNGKGFKIHR
jgi:hypothetical protein